MNNIGDVHPRGLPKTLFLEACGFILIFSVLGAVSGGLAFGLSLTLITAALGIMAAAIMVISLRAYKFAFAAYAFLSVATYDFTGYWPLLSQPVRVFFADGILLFIGVLLLMASFKRIRSHDLRSPMTLLLAANLVFGGAAVVLGLDAGNSVNDVLGGFRRLFLYPLAALIPLYIPISRFDVRRLVVLFGLALVCTSVAAFARSATGLTWDPAQFEPAGQFRGLGYSSGILLLMGLGLFYGILLKCRGNQRWLSLTLVLIFAGALFVSGYRLLWGMTICIPLFVSYATSRGASRVVRLIVVGGVIALVLFGLGLSANLVFPNTYASLVDRFQSGVLGFNFYADARYFAWRTAWARYLKSPLLGVGIGDQLQYLAMNSAGGFYIRNGTTHNILLTLLYESGVGGIGLFLAIQVAFISSFRRNWVKAERGARCALLGMLAGYLAALTMAMFQPFLESPGDIVTFYLWMGMTMRMGQLAAHARAVAQALPGRGGLVPPFSGGELALRRTQHGTRVAPRPPGV